MLVSSKTEDVISFLVKHLMTETKHVSLAKALCELFPKLFGFQSCGIMFYEEKSNDLFSIQHSSDAKAKDYDSVIKYPKENGFTGSAIISQKPVYFCHHQKPANYAEDIDNIVGAHAVESMLIHPIILEGKLHGVIQLVNKLNGESITSETV